jgi:NAD+ kinase
MASAQGDLDRGRSVLIVVNREKPGASQSASEVRAMLESEGARVVDVVDASGEPIEGELDFSMVLVLGGDGTLLAQGRRFGRHGVALVGVNLGRLGFLAQFDVEAVRSHARYLATGELRIDERMLIEVRVLDEDGGERFSSVAMNDVVLQAGPPYRMLEMVLRVAGEGGPRWRGDGVVISTPTGSTGHNASAGGPILAPNLEALSITPLAAHSLAFRPIVVGSGQGIELLVLQANDSGQSGTMLVIDGQVQHRVSAGDRVCVGVLGERVRLVTSPSWNYWSTLLRKLHWAVRPGPDSDSGVR